MTIHYRYGGSTASRTLNCPAWHTLSDGMPKPQTSPAAKLGTSLHTIIELCLLDVDIDPYAFADTRVNGVSITEDHISEKICPALDAFESLMDAYSVDKYWCEVTACIAEDIGGTADFVGLSADGKTLLVADYKSGDGTMVYAEDNAQGLFYAMCLFNDLKQRFTAMFSQLDKIVIAIVQPSHRRDDVIDVWEIKPIVIKTFTHAYAQAVMQSQTKSAPCIGDHCQYCPAEATCPAKTSLALDVERLPIESIVPEQISEALAIAGNIEGWIKAVRKFAHEQAELGVEIAGQKLVHKRATRVWNNPDAVARKIKLSRRLKMAECYVTKLVTPPQMEKVLKGHELEYKEFEPFVSAVSSGTTLVKASDKRAAIQYTEAAKFVASRFA